MRLNISTTIMAMRSTAPTSDCQTSSPLLPELLEGARGGAAEDVLVVLDESCAQRTSEPTKGTERSSFLQSSSVLLCSMNITGEGVSKVSWSRAT